MCLPNQANGSTGPVFQPMLPFTLGCSCGDGPSARDTGPQGGLGQGYEGRGHEGAPALSGCERTAGRRVHQPRWWHRPMGRCRQPCLRATTVFGGGCRVWIGQGLQSSPTDPLGPSSGSTSPCIHRVLGMVCVQRVLGTACIRYGVCPQVRGGMWNVA